MAVGSRNLQNEIGIPRTLILGYPEELKKKMANSNCKLSTLLLSSKQRAYRYIMDGNDGEGWVDFYERRWTNLLRRIREDDPNTTELARTKLMMSKI
jgi:hypothetical protein